MKLHFASIVLMLAATPAAAQINGSASGWSSAPVEASQEEYWNFMGRLGTCLAENKADEAQAFVGSVIDSEAEGEAFDALFDRRFNQCMRNYVSAGVVRSRVRGVVAEGLFELLPDETIAQFTAAPPAAPETIGTLHDLARCYVVTHPADARQLLRETRVATQGELEFIQAIAPDLGPCMPQGRDVRLQATSLRMAIAEAAWRAATGREAPTMQGRS